MKKNNKGQFRQRHNFRELIMVFFACDLYVLTKNIVEYKCANNLLQNSIAFNIGEKYQKAGY